MQGLWRWPGNGPVWSALAALAPAAVGIGWRSGELLSDARDAEGRGEQAQVAVAEAGGASGDVKAEAN
jgi:hypothetical protein